jgi:hypothetical protein
LKPMLGNGVCQLAHNDGNDPGKIRHSATLLGAILV